MRTRTAGKGTAAGSRGPLLQLSVAPLPLEQRTPEITAMSTQISTDASGAQETGEAAHRLTAAAPWHNGLSQAATEVLDLPALRTLSTETVDVAVIGGGVA